MGRRKREDSSDEEGDDCRQKRTAETTVKTVEQLMRELSFPGHTPLELKLGNLGYLLGKGMSVDLKENLINELVICLGYYPGQASAYATLVGLINVADFEFGSECLLFMAHKVGESVHIRDWNRCRGVVHCMVDLYQLGPP